MSEEVITLSQLRSLCEAHERTLRLQHENGQLDPTIDSALAQFPGDTINSALNRLGYLKHVYMARHEGRRTPGAGSHSDSESEAMDAARQLIRREPVRLDVGNDRTVEVTGRSYAAMYEISCHWVRIRELESSLESDTAMRTMEAYRSLAYEILLHRRAIWAHALTVDGAPAKSFSESPAWWREISPADDARLLAALFESMHVRYHKLGQLPKSKRNDKKKDEDFGWHSLLASIEARRHTEPAALYNADLFQIVTRERLAADTYAEDDFGR
jgi:hypothetical protein